MLRYHEGGRKVNQSTVNIYRSRGWDKFQFMVQGPVALCPTFPYMLLDSTFALEFPFHVIVHIFQALATLL